MSSSICSNHFIPKKERIPRYIAESTSPRGNPSDGQVLAMQQMQRNIEEDLRKHVAEMKEHVSITLSDQLRILREDVLAAIAEVKHCDKPQEGATQNGLDPSKAVKLMMGQSALALKGQNGIPTLPEGQGNTKSGGAASPARLRLQKSALQVVEENKTMDVFTHKKWGVPELIVGPNAGREFGDRRGTSQFDSRCIRFLKSEKFDLIVGLMIIANSVVMALELEYEGAINAAVLDLKKDSDFWPGAEDAFIALEHIFVIFFFFELIARVYTCGVGYLKDFANAFDALVVLVSVIEMYVLATVGLHLPNITFLRLFRMARLVRVLRIVRVMRIFRQLRILVHSIASSMGALFWSVILLAIIQMIAGIFMSQSLQPYLRNAENSEEDRQYVYHYLGTFARSLITMFQLTLAPGTLDGVGRFIIYEVNQSYSIFFLLYAFGVTFAIIRVITAIFLKETLASANTDQDIVIGETLREKDVYMQNMQVLFKEIDVDNDQYITRGELDVMLQDTRCTAWLHHLDLTIREVSGFFCLIDDGDEKLTFPEFISGVLRLKGGAKSIDIATLLYENKKLAEKVTKTSKGIEIANTRVNLLLNVLGVDEMTAVY